MEEGRQEAKVEMCRGGAGGAAAPTKGIWLFTPVCIRWAMICEAALLPGPMHTGESLLRRDLLARAGCDHLSHRTGSNGWEWSAGKTLSFVSVAASELEETLIQGDGPGTGYNYVSVLFCSLAE